MLSSYFVSLGGGKLFKRQKGAVFIVIEGPDGAGKTTQAGILKNEFERCGSKVYLTKEPTNVSEAGKKIRRVLKHQDSVDAIDLQKLFIEDRGRHIDNEIIPALDRREIVICDRYFFSTFAYGTIDKKDVSDLINLNKNFILPDITIVLSVNPENCIKRLDGRTDGKEIFERVDKLAKVNDFYKAMQWQFPNIEVLDGEGRIEEINSKIISLLKAKLGI